MDKPIKHIEQIEAFIDHNLKLGYIKPDTTVSELLQFTRNIKDNFYLWLSKLNH